MVVFAFGWHPCGVRSMPELSLFGFYKPVQSDIGTYACRFMYTLILHIAQQVHWDGTSLHSYHCRHDSARGLERPAPHGSEP